MKPVFYFIIIIALFSCKKESLKQTPAQQMEYKDLQEKEIGYREWIRLDLDNNGTNDLAFTTYHIGDPLLQMDKIQFCALSLVGSYFPISADDNVEVLNKGDLITTNAKENFEWFEVSLLVMAQKNIPLAGSVFWSGNWRTANHNYLPVQLARQGKRYNGWVELSYDMEKEKFILHRAAFSTIANADIKAGF